MKRSRTISKRFSRVFNTITVTLFLLTLSVDHAPQAQAAKPIEIKLGHPDSPTHYSHVVLQNYIKKVEAQTNGQVHFTIYPSAQLAPPPKTFGAVVNGIMDAGKAPEGFTSRTFPLNIATTYMLRAPSAEIATRVRLDLFKKFKELREEYKDVHLLFQYVTPTTNIHTTFPARTLADLEGKGLRVPGGQVMWAKALKTSPVTMPMGETYLALSKGVVDGLISSNATLKSFKLVDVTKYSTELRLFSSPFFVFMNKDIWESLPADVQKVFDDLSEWASIEMAKASDVANHGSITFAKSKGHEFITPTAEAMEEFNYSINQLHQSWVLDWEAKGLPGKEIVKEVTAGLKKYSAGN